MCSSGNRGWESRLQSFTGALLTIYWRLSSRISTTFGCCGCSMPSGWTASKGRLASRQRSAHSAPAAASSKPDAPPLLHPAGKPVLIVLLADIFHQLVARLNQRCLKDHRKRPRVCTRIINGHLAHQMTRIYPPPPLDGVQLCGMWRRSSIEPELVVEPDGVDDEGVVLVPADGMTEPRGLEIGGMPAAVQKGLSE